MAERIDLADPSFEPSDEQLAGLSARAFAGVAALQAAARERLRAEIAAERVRTLAVLDERLRTERSSPCNRLFS